MAFNSLTSEIFWIMTVYRLHQLNRNSWDHCTKNSDFWMMWILCRHMACLNIGQLNVRHNKRQTGTSIIYLHIWFFEIAIRTLGTSCTSFSIVFCDDPTHQSVNIIPCKLSIWQLRIQGVCKWLFFNVEVLFHHIITFVTLIFSTNLSLQ